MNANAKAWVAALRSGDFKQTTNRLHKRTNEDSYCCLGVACVLYAQTHTDLEIEQHGVQVSYNNMNGSLPQRVASWLGLNSQVGGYYAGPFKEYNTLVEANDGGKNFNQIADIIENEPLEMFRNE